MKRDLDLLRRILVAVEESDGTKPLSGDSLAGLVDSDTRSVNFHLKLLADARWIETVGSPHYTSQTFDAVPDLVVVASLTNEGHAFLEAVGEPSRWNRFLLWAGEKVADAGLTTVLQLATRFVTSS